MQYGGFWKRLVAYLIDLVPLIIIGLLLGTISGQDLLNPDADPTFGFTDIIGIIIGIGYFAGFESSSWQATPGKRALGLIVVDTNGGRISFGKAVGRYFAKILSGLILLIGYIMIAFTARKQGLHDMIVGTLVVEGTPGGVGFDSSVFE
jgi:uncharacterized RDD family membrane protein YckC